MTAPVDKSSHFQGEQRLYMIVARKLTQMIADHRFDPNWRMPTERDLADMLGVGRPVIREAVIALEVRGLVQVRGRAGIIILPQNELPAPALRGVSDAVAGIGELIDARFAVETNAALLAAERTNAYDLAILDDCLTKMQTGVADIYDLQDVDRLFHFTIGRMAGNPLLLSMISQVRTEWDNSALIHAMWRRVSISDFQSMWVGDHHAILLALRMRQPTASYKAVARYFRNVRNEFDAADDADSPDNASSARNDHFERQRFAEDARKFENNR
ncbi:FadR family transcriptional regulator [Rhizobium pusense]|uniref:FadR/GntR family transcriptional regulator n=1 Tax=Agrobacterium pusense TaxID=648995 RepID=UPI002449A77E|nr:FadR family transcriptional regulator [Agrobacterium pusense]MDH1098615.1 FadR family transcriptional regulator [Agrobacterium pusense]MDH1115226.1 FadR family transcriptional regulator [Agrobacterium pusense]MDH2197037.1 FadR family transcriptional regulator [Agrobacterium pusense]